MTENRYERAAALWVKQFFNLKDSDVVTDVDFRRRYYGGGCETCGHGADDTFAIEFQLNGRHTEREIGYGYDVTPGSFLEQCVALLDEVE